MVQDYVAPLHELAALVSSNLQDQHDWTSVAMHDEDHNGNMTLRAGRPVLSGLPPRRMYIHPDEQIEAIKAERRGDKSGVNQVPEVEWVIPSHVNEKLSLRHFASWSDSLEVQPPSGATMAFGTTSPTSNFPRHKRFLLAVVHDDSTVSYYMMHDGIVKPRQN